MCSHLIQCLARLANVFTRSGSSSLFIQFFPSHAQHTGTAGLPTEPRTMAAMRGDVGRVV